MADFIDALTNVVQFLEEAVVAYAQTEHGQSHLVKVASDLGVTAEELRAIDAALPTVEQAAQAVKSRFNDSRKKA